jgi:replication factor A1
MTIEDHAEELASDLGVDKAEVIRDLENLVNYSVPVAEAKQSLRRKYGDGGSSSDGAQPTEIGDITPSDGNVSVTGRILTVGTRSIQYQGDEQVIHEGEIADDSGRISYTAWNDFGLEAGESVEIGNAGVREWDGEPELNLGDSTSVSVLEETLSVPYQVGGEHELAALEPGDRGITVSVSVLEVESKTIDGRSGETEILSGVFGDESGRLPFTDWDPHSAIEADATLEIEDVFVREFRGAPSVNVSEFSTVRPLEESIQVSETAPEMAIREAIESGGCYDVELTGNVIDVRDGSGLIERCPECNRVVQNGQCRSHGAVEGVDDLRTKAILDDGTGTATVVLDDELTAAVYGGGIEKATEHARDAMDKEVVADEIAERIVGREHQVRGSLSVDEYGATLNATAFAESDNDPAERARALLAEVES